MQGFRVYLRFRSGYLGFREFRVEDIRVQGLGFIIIRLKP